MWWSLKVGRFASITGLKISKEALISGTGSPWSSPYQGEYFLQPGHVIMEDDLFFMRFTNLPLSLASSSSNYLNSLSKIYILSHLNLLPNSSWSDIA